MYPLKPVFQLHFIFISDYCESNILRRINQIALRSCPIHLSPSYFWVSRERD
jgi:hypothetical protein